MSKFKETKVSSKTYYENSFLHVHEDDILLPDGNPSKRIVATHPGAVSIIAVTKEGELVLVRQYRYPLGVETLEIPAGKIDADELPIDTAKRELEEETGYRTENIRLIGSHATEPGFTNVIIHQFLALDLHIFENRLMPDDGEFVEVLLASRESALSMVANGEIIDLKTVNAINYLTAKGLW